MISKKILLRTIKLPTSLAKVFLLTIIGSKSETYLCYHRDTGIGRAVNIQEKSNIEEFKGRFFKEIEILRMMDHPNVIKLYEVYEDSRRYYLVSELLTGGELFDRISRKKTFSECDAALIMKQILGGISYCHSKNIVHRDIKPQNLLYESNDPSAKLKIVDFATSDIYEPNTVMNKKIGSPYYVAPGVLRGAYNEKCDIWSCGVILYLLLSGYYPFRGDTKDKILFNISKGQYTMVGPEWDHISNEGKDLIKDMLTYDYKNRISAADVLSHAWIKKFSQDNVDIQIERNVLENLRMFNAQHKVSQTVLTFLVSKLTTKSEMENLRDVFIKLDKEGNGKLNKEELIAGYKEVYGDLYIEEEVMDNIMKQVDIKKDGKINYTEFIVATIDKKKLQIGRAHV